MTESITTDELPLDVTALIDVLQYEEEADFPVERGYIWTYCSSVENGNPLFWDDDVAAALTDGPIAPPSMLSTWFRPHHWAPGRAEPKVPLQVHFDMKEALRPPRSDHERQHHDVLRPDPPRRPHHERADPPFGERREDHEARHRPVLGDRRRVPQPATATLVGVESWTGFGYRKADAADASRRRARDHVDHSLLLDAVHVGDELPPLTYDVTATTVVLGALGGRDWRPMHHDHNFAVERNGVRDIFLNTTDQAAFVRALHHRLDRADRAARTAAASACAARCSPTRRW